MSTPTPPQGFDPQNEQPGLSGLAEWPTRAVGAVIDGAIFAVPYLIGFALGRKNTGLFLVFILIAAAVGIWNHVIRQGQTGQTIGKGVVKIKLIDEATGQPVGPAKAFVRQLTHIVDAIICYVGFLWPLWDQKKQTLADKFNNTLVVKA